jgi:hypothetical protein
VGGWETNSQFDAISDACLAKIKSMNISMGHTSTGGMLISGMESLPTKYRLPRNEVCDKSIKNNPTQCLSQMQAPDFNNATLVNYYQGSDNNYDRIDEFDVVVRQKYTDVLDMGSFFNSAVGSPSTNYTAYFTKLSTTLDALQKDFPGIIIGYWTPSLYPALSAVDSNLDSVDCIRSSNCWPGGNIRSAHLARMIQDHTIGTRPLYDLYDIESTREKTPGGTPCTKTNGHWDDPECECTYDYYDPDSGKVVTYRVMCQEYTADEYHPSYAKQRLAKGFLVWLAQVFCEECSTSTSTHLPENTSPPAGNRITISPNPTAGIISINGLQVSQATLHDLSGRPLLPLPVTDGRVFLKPTLGIKNGVYLLQFSNFRTLYRIIFMQ